MQCHVKKTAPLDIVRGSAASDLQYAYFRPHHSCSVFSYSVFRYEWSTEKWDELPPCPYRDSALVIIDGALTAVGGYDTYYTHTNKLFTFRERDIAFSMKFHKTYRRWVEELPPMKTARRDTTVVSTSDGEYVVVIGGFSLTGIWTSVELFQVSSRRWYTLTDLPQPLFKPTATICGNHIYVVGWHGDGFSCDLPSSDQPTTSQSRSCTLSWSPLPPLPMEFSTAATLCGQLVIVGGTRHGSVNSIHQLVDGQWVEIGSMSSDRFLCLVVSPSPDKLMIVGGETDCGETDCVEECVVQ